MQEFCEESKLKISGSKAEVTERIVIHLQTTPIDCLNMNSSFVKIIRLVHLQITNNGREIHPLPEPSITPTIPPQHHLGHTRTTTTRCSKIFGLIMLLLLFAIAVFTGINDILDMINGKGIECTYKRGWF